MLIHERPFTDGLGHVVGHIGFRRMEKWCYRVETGDDSDIAYTGAYETETEAVKELRKALTKREEEEDE